MVRPKKRPGEAKATKRPTTRISSKKVAPTPGAAQPTLEQVLAGRTAALETALKRAFGAVPLRVFELSSHTAQVRFIAVGGTAKPLWHMMTSGLLAHGAEISFRVMRARGETVPPPWLRTFFTSLIGRAADGALTEGQVLHFDEKFGTGLAEIDTDMQAVALGIDPLFALPQVLLAVGLTRDEERLVREWSPQGFLEVLARIEPSLTTDLERPSSLVSPRTRGVIESRVSAEGSSLGVLQVTSSEVSSSPDGELTWSLAADAIETVLSLVKGRIGHLRPFSVKTANSTVDLIPADFPSVERVEGRLTIKLSQPAARQVRATLKAKPGQYRFEALPKLTLDVVA